MSSTTVANRPGSSANVSQERCRICAGSCPAIRPRVMEVFRRMATIPARGPCPETSQMTAAARPSGSVRRSQKSPASTPSAGRSTPLTTTPLGPGSVRAASSRRIASVFCTAAEAWRCASRIAGASGRPCCW